MRTRSLAAIAVFFAAAQSGCGFSPLYTEPEAQIGVVDIAVPPGEGGYAFRQGMIESVGVAGVDAPYRMEVDWRESILPRSRAIDASISFIEASVTADYRLVRRVDGAVIIAGTETVTTGFDAPTQQFAVQTGRRAAFERAAEEIAAIIGRQTALALRSEQ